MTIYLIFRKTLYNVVAYIYLPVADVSFSRLGERATANFEHWCKLDVGFKMIIM